MNYDFTNSNTTNNNNYNNTNRYNNRTNKMKKKTDFSTTGSEVILYFILCAVVSILWAYVTN
tara:strand:- start:219 stop:404 length:186 start_codon:yes stop_codon:yes gene_type:complete